MAKNHRETSLVSQQNKKKVKTDCNFRLVHPYSTWTNKVKRILICHLFVRLLKSKGQVTSSPPNNKSGLMCCLHSELMLKSAMWLVWHTCATFMTCYPAIQYQLQPNVAPDRRTFRQAMYSPECLKKSDQSSLVLSYDNSFYYWLRFSLSFPKSKATPVHNVFFFFFFD